MSKILARKWQIFKFLVSRISKHRGKIKRKSCREMMFMLFSLCTVRSIVATIVTTFVLYKYTTMIENNVSKHPVILYTEIHLLRSTRNQWRYKWKKRSKKIEKKNYRKMQLISGIFKGSYLNVRKRTNKKKYKNFNLINK